MSLFKRLRGQPSEPRQDLTTAPQIPATPPQTRTRSHDSRISLTPALRARCEEALSQRLQQAEQALQQRWPRPVLRFNQRGKSAGTAHLQRWEIRLNAVLLAENQALFLHEVIAHELAHLLVFARHGRTRPHGPEWQRLMRQVFGLPARVTHDLDVSAVSGPQFAYRCGCRDHQLSLRRHNKVLRHQARYLCRHCGHALTAVTTASS